LRELFGDKVFDNPKPVDVISRLMQITPGSKDGLILDFFAGSGSTGHAVYDLNRADGGSRRFILVQLPEPTGRSDYRTVSAITRERLKRAGRLYESSTLKADVGFRAFRLDSSNFRPWESRGADSTALETQLSLHADHIVADSSAADILCELLTKDGFPLAISTEKLELAGKEVFSIADGALLICLDKQLTQEVIDEMADLEPSRVICLDAGFQGNDQLKANAVQTFKARARNRETAIEFRTV
jgi:adenine-specific DNA-methyltransferase